MAHVERINANLKFRKIEVDVTYETKIEMKASIDQP